LQPWHVLFFPSFFEMEIANDKKKKNTRKKRRHAETTDAKHQVVEPISFQVTSSDSDGHEVLYFTAKDEAMVYRHLAGNGKLSYDIFFEEFADFHYEFTQSKKANKDREASVFLRPPFGDSFAKEWKEQLKNNPVKLTDREITDRLSDEQIRAIWQCEHAAGEGVHQGISFDGRSRSIVEFYTPPVFTHLH
jgi:hypothetical protein